MKGHYDHEKLGSINDKPKRTLSGHRIRELRIASGVAEVNEVIDYRTAQDEESMHADGSPCTRAQSGNHHTGR